MPSDRSARTLDMCTSVWPVFCLRRTESGPGTLGFPKAGMCLESSSSRARCPSCSANERAEQHSAKRVYQCEQCRSCSGDAHDMINLLSMWTPHVDSAHAVTLSQSTQIERVYQTLYSSGEAWDRDLSELQHGSSHDAL